LRTDKGLSQNRLAPLIGYSQQNVSDWEKGKIEPNANALVACALFFDVSTDYLLGLETEEGLRIRTPKG
jgi:transcriptional regulator with XRE-family HTH domain